MFLIFTNDLTSHICDAKVVLYADDAQFIHRGSPRDLVELQDSVQSTLSRVNSWFVQNRLKINPHKSDILLVASSRRRLSADFEINFDNAVLHPAQKIKVLGVVLDKSLNFEDHISAVIRRCYATLGGISKMSRRLPGEVKKLLIESLVFPHILYCTTVWAGCNVTQRRRLQKVINHSARIVKNLRRSEHITPHLKDLQWHTVERLVEERDVAMLHRILFSSHAPNSLRDQITYRADVSERETRASVAGSLQLPRVRTEHSRRSFPYRAVLTWNRTGVTDGEAGT